MTRASKMSIYKASLQYRASVDSSAREGLIKAHAPLVRYIAESIASRLPGDVDAADLYGAGILGLIDAVDRYDSKKSSNFKSYATFRIKGAIIDELRKNDWIPRSIRKEIGRIEAVVRSLQTRLKRDPDEDEVACALGVDLETYRKMLTRCRSVALFPISEEILNEEDVAGYIDGNDNPEKRLEKKELQSILAGHISRLKKKEQLVLSLYYFEEMTLKEIAKILDLTEARICQIHTQAILKLRSRLMTQKETFLARSA